MGHAYLQLCEVGKAGIRYFCNILSALALMPTYPPATVPSLDLEFDLKLLLTILRLVGLCVILFFP